MTSNRRVSEVYSHMKHAAVSTLSSIPLFLLSAILKDVPLHQSWHHRGCQWHKNER
jgi:hypothetical protein